MSCDYCNNNGNQPFIKQHGFKYCPMCGESFMIPRLINELNDIVKFLYTETVEIDGETLTVERTPFKPSKNVWAFDFEEDKLDLDKIDISKELEWLEDYNRKQIRTLIPIDGVRLYEILKQKLEKYELDE